MKNETDSYVENDKDNKNTNVPPTLRILDVKVVAEIFVRRAIATKLALGGRGGVREVSSVVGNIPCEVFGTRLTRRWINMSELDIGTVDLLSADG